MREPSRFALVVTMESLREPCISVVTARVEYASDNEVDAPPADPLSAARHFACDRPRRTLVTGAAAGL